MKAFGLVSLSYLLAIMIGCVAGCYFFQQGYHLLWAIAIADIVATIIIFIFSYFFSNSSFYDPYWSVIPIVISGVMAYMGWESGADQTRIIVVGFLVSFWGIRLTLNWMRGWEGLKHEDWRYIDLQKKHGKWYWWVSFSGIHLFPTLLVYLGCLTLYPCMLLSGNPFGWLDILATLFTLGAILIEWISDEQLKRFVKQKKEQKATTLVSGLWRYSRNPNYFGETAFWWGLWFFAIIAVPEYWWTGIGALSMTALFHFISIPMKEERMLARRPEYQELIEKIPRWIPWWPRE